MTIKNPIVFTILVLTGIIAGYLLISILLTTSQSNFQDPHSKYTLLGYLSDQKRMIITEIITFCQEGSLSESSCDVLAFELNKAQKEWEKTISGCLKNAQITADRQLCVPSISDLFGDKLFFELVRHGWPLEEYLWR